MTATGIVNACGGEIVGRVRLQKLAYLAERIGCKFGFEFQYYHYGPFSEDLVNDINNAIVEKEITEEIKETVNGSRKYSIFKLPTPSNNKDSDNHRTKFLKKAKNIETLYLELLATALFLHEEDATIDSWKKLQTLKPNKAQNKFLKKSYKKYCELQKLSEELAGIETLPKLPTKLQLSS